MPSTALAVDLGSSSGRVIAGQLADGHLRETEVHRFAHEARMVDGYLSWDVDFIWQQVVEGLRRAVAQFPDASSVSVCTWGVDYVVLDAEGNRLTPGRCYRDERTLRTLDAFRARLSDEEVWRTSGIAPHHINSANQLFAMAVEEPDVAAAVHRVLFLPDYFAWLLTGIPGWSRSIASTSSLCQPGAHEWADEVFDALGIPRTWFGEITPERTVVGTCTVPGLEQLTVVRAGAHDTACAVNALERGEGENYFLSCGSWSVLGVLRDEPLLSDAARDMGLTNEARGDEGLRPLFNITGLWMLQECQREWTAAGQESGIVALLEMAEAAPSLGVVIDPDESRFGLKGDMLHSIADALAEQGVTAEPTQGEVVRLLMESLAARYARGIAGLAELTGAEPSQLNLMGGGSRNRLLCDLTAQAVGVPVISGPVEATTMGSLLAQFEISGALSAEDRNAVIASSAHTRKHQP